MFLWIAYFTYHLSISLTSNLPSGLWPEIKGTFAPGARHLGLRITPLGVDHLRFALALFPRLPIAIFPVLDSVVYDFNSPPLECLGLGEERAQICLSPVSASGLAH